MGRKVKFSKFEIFFKIKFLIFFVAKGLGWKVGRGFGNRGR